MTEEPKTIPSEPVEEVVPEVPERPEADENDRLMGALAYIVAIILPAVILASEASKIRPFQRYHAIQSLAVSVVSLIWTLLVFIATAIMGAICGPLTCLILPLYLAPLVPMVWAAYHAYSGEWVEIPGLTQFLKDQRWL